MPSSEGLIVAATEWPLTLESLTGGLRGAGVTEGQTVLVHSSLSSLGWVVGGPVAVVRGVRPERGGDHEGTRTRR